MFLWSAWFWAFFNAVAGFPADRSHARGATRCSGCRRRNASGSGALQRARHLGRPRGHRRPSDPWHPAAVETRLLLLTLGHHGDLGAPRGSWKNNTGQGLKYGLIRPCCLGATFTCVQAFEYRPRRFSFAGQCLRRDLLHGEPASTAFHVLVGTIFLIVCPRPAPMPATPFTP